MALALLTSVTKPAAAAVAAATAALDVATAADDALAA